MLLQRKIGKFIKSVLPQIAYLRISYSQDGEDRVLQSFFETRNKYKGFYVDIGAHHPYRFSNTAIFYAKGWSGINIEPTPTLIQAFYKYRKRDINLNIGIAEQNGKITFLCLANPL
jgi:hypothetical protein